MLFCISTSTKLRSQASGVREDGEKIQVSENSEDDENEGDEKKEDTVQDREKWDLSGDIMDCFQRYSSELSQEEQEEIIKGIEDGLTDQEIKRYLPCTEQIKCNNTEGFSRQEKTEDNNKKSRKDFKSFLLFFSGRF